MWYFLGTVSIQYYGEPASNSFSLQLTACLECMLCVEPSPGATVAESCRLDRANKAEMLDLTARQFVNYKLRTKVISTEES